MKKKKIKGREKIFLKPPKEIFFSVLPKVKTRKN